MTKVLAFCDYLQEPMGGGAEIVSAEVYRRLASSDDFSITVLTGVTGPTRPGEPAGPDVEVRARRGLDMSRLLGAQLSIAPGIIVEAWRQVRRNRPDVIHASSVHFFGSIIAAVTAAITKIPLVTTAHLSGLDALPAKTRRIGGLYEKTVGAFILKRSSRVIAVSNAVADHVADHGAKPGTVVVVENGVDTQRFEPGPRSETNVVVTFVGRLIDNKGPLLLVDAFSHVASADARLRIVGAGPLADEVRDRAARDSRIEVLGHREDVEALLATSDIFVRPSTTEGRSLAVLEASG